MKKIKRKKGQWITKDKCVLKIREMSDSHIVNSIRMLDRAFDRNVSDCCAAAAMLNGEMAQYSAESELDHMLNSGPSYIFGSVYDELVVEKNRRARLQQTRENKKER